MLKKKNNENLYVTWRSSVSHGNTILACEVIWDVDLEESYNCGRVALRCDCTQGLGMEPGGRRMICNQCYVNSDGQNVYCPDCIEEQELMDEAYFLVQAYNDVGEEE